ncbi:MAG: aldehyde dehydrogenase family protein [Sphingobacteriia bacterium]|nr:aldehyde dehydrogenase family protein [Sphingobacteriia bacterium]
MVISEYKIFDQYAEFIDQNRNVIFEILTEIATYKSIEDEIERSIRVLKNAASELIKENPPQINNIAIYHSSNAILYTFVLYCLIASAYTKNIYIRPSHQVSSPTSKIVELFTNHFKTPIKLCNFGQRTFAYNVGFSDVIIFTGRYENSLEVISRHKHHLFLFFGSGTNAMILGNNFDLEEFTNKSISSRIFNSGQDCMCPNIIFVPNSIVDDYATLLIKKLELLKYGPRNNPSVDYSDIFYEGVVEDVQKYLTENHKWVIYNKNREEVENNNLLHPIVLKSSIKNMAGIMEYFSPVFNIVAYDNFEELSQFLSNDHSLEHAMFLSVFGEETLSESLHNYYCISKNQTIFEFENGNYPFGGYGIKANFVKSENISVGKPILISKEIANHFNKIKNNESTNDNQESIKLSV